VKHYGQKKSFAIFHKIILFYNPVLKINENRNFSYNRQKPLHIFLPNYATGSSRDGTEVAEHYPAVYLRCHHTQKNALQNDHGWSMNPVIGIPAPSLRRNEETEAISNDRRESQAPIKGDLNIEIAPSSFHFAGQARRAEATPRNDVPSKSSRGYEAISNDRRNDQGQLEHHLGHRDSLKSSFHFVSQAQ